MSKTPKRPCTTRSAAAFAARPVVFSVLLALCGLATAQAYHFATLPRVSTDRNTGYGINARGDVVGTNGPGLGSFSYSATLWRAGVPTALSPNAGSIAFAINDAGVAAGQDPMSRAVLWTGTQAALLPSLGGGFSTASALNERGQVVGWSNGLDANGNLAPQQAVRWDQGSITSLGTLGGNTGQALSINEAGWVAGWSQLADGTSTHATLWRDGATIDLGTAGAAFSRAEAINDHGLVAGTSQLLDAEGEDGATRAVTWHDGAITVLDLAGPDWATSFARGVNNAGQVVGGSWRTGNDRTSATLWNGLRAIDLNTFLSGADTAAGWQLIEANDINDSGWITGTAYNRQTFQFAAYLLSIPPIPEPASLGLMAAGLAVVWGARRRTRRGIETSRGGTTP